MANQKKEKKSAPVGGDEWEKNELFLFEPRTLFLIIAVSVLTLLISFFGKDGARFLTSVLTPIPEHAPFDGTVSPVQQVPDWVKLTEAERKMGFAELPKSKLISLPSYNPSRLSVPMSSLAWNNAEDDQIRNEKITYSVPYLGNYKLDGLENVGSHPAVDIKIPEGTPLFAIANGTVIKTEISNGGFGNHIVIQHNGVSSSSDPSGKETIFSVYAHMSSFSVSQYDVVTKGQMIGFSGKSGLATTPHIHFQIDRDSAPWHAYWPFSGADMRAAGMSFFDAINKALKQENALAHTLNPMVFIQKFAGVQNLVVSADPALTQAISEAKEDPLDKAAFLIQTEGDAKNITEGDELRFVIQLFDGQGNVFEKPGFSGTVSLSLLYGNATLNQNEITSEQLQTGITTAVRMTATKAGKEKLILRFREKEYSSPEVEIAAKPVVEPVVSPVETGTTTEVVPSESSLGTSTEVVIPIETGTTTESAGTTTVEQPVPPPAQLVILPFSDVAVLSPYFEALTELKKQNLVAGYADGSFKPEKEVSRAEAIAFILRGINESVEQSLGISFPDVKEEAWYFNFVATAFKLGFVKGYPDGSFKPESTVTLAEFFTMLFVASKTDIDPQVSIELPSGMTAADWFTPYLQEAMKKGILVVEKNSVEPGKNLTRGEISKILWTMLNVEKKN